MIYRLFLLLFIPALSFAQIRSFKGGSSDFTMENGLTPFGSSVSGDISSISSNFAGMSALFNNPVGLYRGSGTYVDLDLSLPGLNTKLTTDGILKDPVKEGVDGAFEDVDPSKIQYPNVSFGVQDPMDVRGIGFFKSDSIGEHQLHYGFGYSQTQKLAIVGDLQGLTVEIASALEEDNAASDSLYALLRTMFSLDFQWTIKEYSSAIAYKHAKYPVVYGFGFKYNRFDYKMSSFFRGDGYLARNGLTYGFYTPGLNYPDSLYANYFGSGEGGSPGVQLGVSWLSTDWLNVDAYFDWNGNIDVDGDFRGYGYNLFGLDPSSGDMSMSDMNLTKLTLTQRHEYEIKNMILQLPSKVGLSVTGSWKGGDVKTNLSYAYYYKDMEWKWDYTHSKTKMDSTKEVIQDSQGNDSLFTSNSTYGFAFEKAHLVNLGFDLYGWHWNFGAMVWDRTAIFHKNKKTEWADIPNLFPHFSFGWKTYLGEHLELDLALIALPESFLKTSVRYQF